MDGMSRAKMPEACAACDGKMNGAERGRKTGTESFHAFAPLFGETE